MSRIDTPSTAEARKPSGWTVSQVTWSSNMDCWFVVLRDQNGMPVIDQMGEVVFEVNPDPYFVQALVATSNGKPTLQRLKCGFTPI